MLNLDTHILIHFLQGTLTESEKEWILKEELAISDIVLWELTKLSQLKKIQFNFEDKTFQTFLHSLKILPITLEIAQESCQLDFKSDPADEIIAATSLVYGIPLLTRDKAIQRSKKVPWKKS